MTELFRFVWALMAGLGLGAFHFGGLWLSARQLSMARRPALLALGSFLGRTVVTLSGFYLVSGGHWARLAICLLGFLVMRSVLIRCWGVEEKPVTSEGGISCS